MVAKEGFASVSVSAVCDRARISRQVFFSQFEGLKDCFLAVLDDSCDQATDVILRAFRACDEWRDGVREALCSVLVLFESDPGIARVWMLESAAAGPWALERRERNVAALTEAILEHWQPPEEAGSHPMAAAAAMAGILAVIQRHLATGATEPLIDLLGPLMGIAVDPFLPAHQVAAEIRRSGEFARQVAAGAQRPVGLPARPGCDVPPSLLHPRADRARACLLFLAQRPGASNRDAARAIGISSAAQISTLLSRLRELGLASKHEAGAGHPNAWHLTQTGCAVARVLGSQASAGTPFATASGVAESGFTAPQS
ncbi:MAG: hypothetical protein ACTHNP_07120 [Solirubrobacterales bacterium]